MPDRSPIFATGRFPGNGWVVGHMAQGPLQTGALEVKWAYQPSGDAGFTWRRCQSAVTLSVLVHGRFQMEFRAHPDAPVTTVLLEEPGSYVIFGPEYEHRSWSLAESLFLTIRWPSINGDCSQIEP